jgi:phosphoribosylformylglycinamidine synthase
MLGILEDPSMKMTLDFKQEGDLIYLIGQAVNDIASSEYVYSYKKIKATPAPHFNLETEQKVQKSIAGLIAARLIQSAHDVSDGGLLITLAESSFPRKLGFSVQGDVNIRRDACWFGEAQSRVVVSIDAQNKAKFESYLNQNNQGFSLIGEVKGKDMSVDNQVVSTLQGAFDSYHSALETALMK